MGVSLISSPLNLTPLNLNSVEKPTPGQAYLTGSGVKRYQPRM